MSINGQTMNYKKYYSLLKEMPAPILHEQIPAGVKLDLAGLVAYAKEKGVQPSELSNAEKNQFVTGGEVETLQETIRQSIKYRSLDEWNLAHCE